MSIDPGQSSASKPPTPRRRRRRRRVPTAATENKSNADRKSTETEEATQAPAKLDDSSDAGTKGDNGNGDN